MHCWKAVHVSDRDLEDISRLGVLDAEPAKFNVQTQITTSHALLAAYSRPNDSEFGQHTTSEEEKCGPGEIL